MAERSDNGFDFLIDPYRFGGSPLSATSKPYPLLVDEEFLSLVEGAFDVELFSCLEEMTSSSQALDGTIRSTLLFVSVGPDSLDGISAVALEGTMTTVLRVIDAGLDEFDGVLSAAIDGQMQRILIIINVDEQALDGFDGVHAMATGGTLS